MDQPVVEAPAEQKQKPNVKITLPNTPTGTTGKITTVQREDGGCDFVTILDDEVIFPDPYMEMIYLMNRMTEKDTLTILISSNGGWVETGVDIIHTIQHCRGKVITHALAMCASIAAVIWCCGHERKIEPTATLMFHMPSGGYFGKTMDVADESSSMVNYFRALLASITHGILTQEDITKVVDQRMDVFIPGDVVINRLNALRTKQEDQHEA